MHLSLFVCCRGHHPNTHVTGLSLFLWPNIENLKHSDMQGLIGNCHRNPNLSLKTQNKSMGKRQSRGVGRAGKALHADAHTPDYIYSVLGVPELHVEARDSSTRVKN